MVNLICGPAGSGKTQKLIQLANDELSKTKGLIVYIDADDKHRLNIANQIRYINAKEFMIDDPEKFFGFICGIISENYDINRVYVDNINQIANISNDAVMKEILHKLKNMQVFSGVEFYFTIDNLNLDSDETEEYDYQTMV